MPGSPIKVKHIVKRTDPSGMVVGALYHTKFKYPLAIFLQLKFVLSMAGAKADPTKLDGPGQSGMIKAAL